MPELAVQAPVAIVGMAALFPGAPDSPAYWRNIVNGVDAISEMPAGRVDRAFYDPESWHTPSYDSLYAWRGGFIDDFATFDPGRYGVMPVAVESIEPDQLLALRIASEAIHDAGGPDRLPDRERIGVVLGRGGYLGHGMSRASQRIRTSRQIITILEQVLPGIAQDQLEEVRRAFTASLGPEHPESMIGLVPNLTASRIANRLDLHGPAYTVDAACASSLLAVEQGIRDLHSGRCDMVLAGGVHHCHDVILWSVFCQLRAVSPSQQIRPFDRRADGVLIGEGTGVVALKRLDDALRDEDRIYAVIRGTGVASDGRATSLMAPHSSGQVLAIRQAWAAAGLDPTAPGAVGLIEAHGTGTPAGDAAELATLREVFGDDLTAGRIGLGSVKSMIGHAMPAAGVAGIIKAAYALHHATLPPTLHCDEPHDMLSGSRFQLLRTAERWESTGHRRAGVNAFGFGGINAHIVLEQAPAGAAVTLPQQYLGAQDAVATTDADAEIVLRLAARTPVELARLLDESDISLARGGMHGPGGHCRLAMVDPTPGRLALARKIMARGTPWRGRNDVWFTASPMLGTNTAEGGQIAFVFPGVEGSFEPKVAEIAAHFGLSQPAVPGSGYAIVDQMFEILEVGQLLASALGRLRVTPSLVAGHSIGEWTAMLVTDMVPRDSLMAFVAPLYGQSLEIPNVVFAALACGAGVAATAIAQMTAADRDLVAVSHDNCPYQSIVCGEQEVVIRLLRQLQSHGVLGQVLPFRHGFHTPMLEPYLAPFLEGIARVPLARARLPVWSATTLQPYPEEHAAIRALMARHLVEPVRFRELVERLYATGARVFVQMGVGSALAFADDTLRGREHLTISAHASGKATGLGQLHRVAASLWVEGADPDFSPLEVAAGSRTVQPVHAQAEAGPVFQPMRLDLRSPLVRLGPEVRPLRLPATAGVRLLDTRAVALGDHPVLAELDVLLQETSGTSCAVLDAWTAASRPSALQPPAHTAPVLPVRQLAGPQPAEPARERTTQQTISVEAMPYLMDHGLFRQRPGWPILSDWAPVVPMTIMIKMMLDEALALAPGRMAVGIETVKALKWLAAVPATTVTIRTALDSPNRVRVSIDGHAYGTVLLADDYPAAPAASSEPLLSEHASDMSADRLYAGNWLFHGPRFQGVVALDGMADNGMRATIITLDTPGALLDNAGQALGYWLARNAETATYAFPSSIGRISFYGPSPLPGDQIACTLWVRDLAERAIRADLELRTSDGQVWACIQNWEDYRFSTDGTCWRVLRKPSESCVAREQPGGWSLAYGEWDPSVREMMMRRYLTECERAEYEQRLPKARGAWLLGRIAVKDAARRWLWARGAGPIFPAEIVVANDASGKPTVKGPFPEPLAVSLAHSADLAVAMVLPERRGATAPGIDVECVKDRDPSFEPTVCTPRERALLDLLAGDGGRPGWVARFWAAKEAVSKAVGTGLRGRPRDFAVVQAEAGGLLQVEHGGRVFRVASTVIEDGTHVVAWVAGSDSPAHTRLP